MADELKDALDQVKKDVGTITDVQSAKLGLPVTALPEATAKKPQAFVYLVSGGPENDTLTATTERHRVNIRYYWLLIPENVETVEQSAATMWDRTMTKFHGDDADRNLTEKATLALIGGEGGELLYEMGYQDISGKEHRVMTVPLEIILDTHSV